MGTAGLTVCLSPVQLWFFRQRFENPTHWNQHVVLEAAEKLDPDALQQAFSHVVRTHDSLTYRFGATSHENTPCCVGYDLSALDSAAEETALQIVARDLHSAFDIERGPLIKLVYILRHQSQPDLVAIAAHHLACDLRSWDIIGSSLESAYKSSKLLAQTASFESWTRALHAFARSESGKQALSYYGASHPDEIAESLEATATLNTVGDERERQASIRRETTAVLCGSVCPQLQVSLAHLLLAAVAKAIGEWVATNEVTVYVEGTGREPFEGCPDISRTTGWFTAVHPCRIRTGPRVSLANAAVAARAALLSAPLGGLAYAMRACVPELYPDAQIADAKPLGVVFGHRTIFGAPERERRHFRYSKRRMGPDSAAVNHRPCVIEVFSLLKDGETTVTIKYGQALHSTAQIDSLLGSIVSGVESMAAADVAQLSGMRGASR